MNVDEYRQCYADNDEAAPGWDAIDSRVREVYGEQEPKHWGTVIKHMLGGPDPIDGISAYQCASGPVEHLHFLTYGYSSLYYDEEAVGGEFSRFGFEMTFRLASSLPPADEPIWVVNLLQNIARYVFESGKWFAENHWIPANGPIRAGYPTDIVGLAFVNDPALLPVDSPHGRVEFVQAFGLTESELESLRKKTKRCESIIAEHRASNPFLVTDLSRKNV